MNFLQGFLMIHELSELENEIQKETVYSMIRLLEKHDPYTKGHSENVAELASGFGEYLGLDSKKAQDLYWAGIIHDLGKILIPHTILNKPDRLTPEEFELIKKHPEYCYDVIGQSVTMKEIALYVKYHHEKYNGKGYPEGLKGEEIPFESRILALADSWDAMREERVYKKGLNYQESINEITRNAGVQFDPQLAEKWVQFIDKKRKEKFGEDSE
jgi:HD-GYP domain-containing protein (c-di-GMP phosphodiesterase class II)